MAKKSAPTRGESGLLFDYDSDVLRANAQQNLATLASSLDKYPGTDVVIVGHTDSRGSDSYNMTLSERRAAAASSYLASRGVTPRSSWSVNSPAD